jgi:hypothetical protein
MSEPIDYFNPTFLQNNSEPPPENLDERVSQLAEIAWASAEGKQFVPRTWDGQNEVRVWVDNLFIAFFGSEYYEMLSISFGIPVLRDSVNPVPGGPATYIDRQSHLLTTWSTDATGKRIPTFPSRFITPWDFHAQYMCPKTWTDHEWAEIGKRYEPLFEKWKDIEAREVAERERQLKVRDAIRIAVANEEEATVAKVAAASRQSRQARP